MVVFVYAGTHAEGRGGGEPNGIEYLSCAFGLAISQRVKYRLSQFSLSVLGVGISWTAIGRCGRHLQAGTTPSGLDLSKSRFIVRIFDVLDQEDPSGNSALQEADEKSHASARQGMPITLPSQALVA